MSALARAKPLPQTRTGRLVDERGYALLDDRLPTANLAFVRERVMAAYDALGQPGTFANPPLEPAPKVEISRVGMVFHQLGAHCPEVAGHFLTEPLVEVARDVLGDDMFLEYSCAVVCNDERPFFPWHMHVGGVDNIVYRKRALFPSFDRCERLGVLVYLDELTQESGPLLVYPRELGASTRPPYDPTLTRWPGDVELRCAPGQVVFLDQCTWHAALEKRSPGVRAFLALYFTAASAAPTSWIDESFDSVAVDHPLLASVLRRPARRAGETPAGR